MYMFSDSSPDRDRNGTYVHGNGTGSGSSFAGAGQLLAGKGGTGTGKLVPCNTLVQTTAHRLRVYAMMNLSAKLSAGLVAPTVASCKYAVTAGR